MTESIYNLDELISKLQKIRQGIGNTDVYIKEIYSSNEYLRISNIRVDEDGDVIIEDNEPV